MRLVDKISFILGVLLLITTTYMLGRYPHSYFYYHHIITVTILVLIRLFNYRKKGWHYYLFDFCYFANFAMIYFLIFAPKNDLLFKIFFVFANGPFGLAIAAFKNSMIFHRLDNLTSISIHLIPMVSAWNLKWYTIPHEYSPEYKILGKEPYFLNLEHLDF